MKVFFRSTWRHQNGAVWYPGRLQAASLPGVGPVVQDGFIGGGRGENLIQICPPRLVLIYVTKWVLSLEEFTTGELSQSSSHHNAPYQSAWRPAGPRDMHNLVMARICTSEGVKKPSSTNINFFSLQFTSWSFDLDDFLRCRDESKLHFCKITVFWIK
jgi:hypothetical protein